MLYVRPNLDHDLDKALGRKDWRELKCPQCQAWLMPCVIGSDPGIGCIECTLPFDLCEIEAKLEGK